MKEFSPSRIIPVGFNIQKGILFGAAVLELAVFLVLLIVPPRSAGVSLVGISLVGILVALAAIAAALVTSRTARLLTVQPEEKAFIPLAAVAFVVMGGFFCVQQNTLEECRSERQFISEIQSATAWIPSDRIVLMYKGEVDAKMVFYLGKGSPVTLLRYKDKYADEQDPDKMAIMSFLQSDRLGALIAQVRYVAALPTELSRLLPAVPTFEEKPLPFESKDSRQERWGVWLLNSQNTTPSRGDKTTNEK